MLPSWLSLGAPQGCHTLGRKPGAVMDAAEALRGLPGSSSNRLQAHWSAGKRGQVEQGASRNPSWSLGTETTSSLSSGH